MRVGAYKTRIHKLVQPHYKEYNNAYTRGWSKKAYKSGWISYWAYVFVYGLGRAYRQ